MLDFNDEKLTYISLLVVLDDLRDVSIRYEFWLNTGGVGSPANKDNQSSGDEDADVRAVDTCRLV